MFIITIPLKHIILDPAKPVDLSVLSEQDAIELIKKAYGFPNETFSCIHLLCLMYVVFKLYDPAVNCGLDFAEAYEMALANQKAVIH
jgi:hypothetical protein